MPTSALEDLLFAYPYLIDISLQNPIRQVFLSPRSRADLLFILQNKVVVVEIKRGPIPLPHITQLKRYFDDLKKSYAHVETYLIGKSVTPTLSKKSINFLFAAPF
jgi:Endonuclease NucS